MALCSHVEAGWYFKGAYRPIIMAISDDGDRETSENFYDTTRPKITEYCHLQKCIGTEQ
jgi:hypothetical protein